MVDDYTFLARVMILCVTGILIVVLSTFNGMFMVLFVPLWAILALLVYRENKETKEANHGHR